MKRFAGMQKQKQIILSFMFDEKFTFTIIISTFVEKQNAKGRICKNVKWDWIRYEYSSTSLVRASVDAVAL